MLHTIQKASEALAFYDHNQTEFGAREVAARLHLAKSSAHDLLASLAEVRLLTRTEEGRYRPGWRLVAMSHTLVSTNRLVQAAPGTRMRGYIESFNGKLRDELLNGEIFYSLKEAKVIIELWRKEYNSVRPHSALQYRPPAPEAMLTPQLAVPLLDAEQLITT